MLQRTWKKAFLIVPPTGKYIREERCQTPLEELHTVALRPPMDLLYMGAVLERAGVECRIADYPAHNRGWDDFVEDLQNFQPDALILSITTPTLEDDMIAAAKAKSIDPGIVTVTKGAHFIKLDTAALDQYPLWTSSCAGNTKKRWWNSRKASPGRT